ncbi:glycosyltransferase [Ectothiorhodospira sp. 9905]|nr:glycosyltransferase [Ectothiorhodospira sp. 9905]
MLEAFCALEFPQGGWKIIAIDNASTDGTSEVLRNYQHRLPLVLLFQPKSGKNASLNMALPHVEGDLVIFTDDDVLPDAGWLTTLLRTAECKPEYDVFAGAIIPEWPKVPPQWILDNVPLGPAYVVTPPDRKEGPLRPSAVWGPNMMIREKIFTMGIRFDEAIGPGLAPNYPMGSETELTERLVAQGHQCWFAPDARVMHIIREEQMRVWWLLKRAFRSGKGEADRQLKAAACGQDKSIFGAPRWLFRRLAKNAWETIQAGVFLGRPGCINSLWQFCHVLGQINHHQSTSRSLL